MIEILRFECYLREENLTQSTIKEHVNNLQRFIVWAKQHHYSSVDRLTYTELLGFVQDLKKRKIGTASVNNRLNSLRKYYEFLKSEGILDVNPARRLHIRGEIKKVVHQPLTYSELEELYYHYTAPRTDYREEKSKKVHQRNGILLGLMIWQALHSGEVEKIELSHVNLLEGTIYIPSTKRSNSRELKLEARQVVALHGYISESEFKADENSMIRLFDCHGHAVFSRLAKELKGINGQIKSALHIRASVILHWLRMYDKRTVQYMIGHKWINSTEHYQMQELSTLTDLLEKHHPFS